MRTESRETIELYVIAAGDFVSCPFTTNQALRRKYSDILMLNIKCVVHSWYPINVLGPPL